MVDAAVGIGAMAAVVGLGFAAAAAYARFRGDGDAREGDEEDEPSDIHRTTREFPQSPQLRAALWGASAGLAVAGRNRRGLGFRVVGLRRVEAQTGGNVSVRSALIGVLFDQTCQAATIRLFGSLAQRQRDHISALAPQMEAVTRKYPGDPQARQRAVMKFYEVNDVNPLGGCGWSLAGPFVTQLVLALASPGGRTVRDRITGTGVIVDR